VARVPRGAARSLPDAGGLRAQPLRGNRCDRAEAGRRRPHLEDRERTPRSRDRAGSARGRLIMAEDDEVELTPPRATAALYCHSDAERALLEAYRGGRLPHAWLISGPAGIGKATLAYRMA